MKNKIKHFIKTNGFIGWPIVIIMGIVAFATWPVLGVIYGIYVLFSSKGDSEKVEILKEIVGFSIFFITLLLYYWLIGAEI